MTERSAVLAEGTTLNWLTLIRAEYLEIPGLHLTQPQAQRLWGLDASTCSVLLSTLVDARFLRRTTQGRYARADLDSPHGTDDSNRDAR